LNNARKQTPDFARAKKTLSAWLFWVFYQFLLCFLSGAYAAIWNRLATPEHKLGTTIALSRDAAIAALQVKLTNSTL
jgi:hypothetical protein